MRTPAINRIDRPVEMNHIDVGTVTAKFGYEVPIVMKPGGDLRDIE